jgi:MFS family permease
MIDRDDVRAAVGSGLISEKQAAGLISLADSRRGAREYLARGDEPFELFKGFNEVFIVIGLLILSMGWWGVVTLALGDRIVDLQRYSLIVGGLGAAFLWLLSEYFIRHRRMVAPAIALAVMFAGNAVFGFTAVLSHPFMIAQGDFSSLPWPLFLAVLTLAVFWWRFRVPFALAMIAVGLFVVAIIQTASNSGPIDGISDLFLLSAGGRFAWITLALGLAVFAAAMAFDMSDPHRVTRRSANGFWLHVVAAPALVNTVALSLLAQDNGASNAVLLAVLTLFALVAIVIDRRSFLIAAIGYIVVLAGTVFDGDGAALTVLLLGLVLLILGAFWERIRARVLRLMPGFVPLHRLPPSHI